MDPLSDVLSLLKPRSYMFRGLDVGGQWSIQFPRHEGIKCYAVVSGQVWLSVEGVPEPAFLKAGDCFLLPRGRPFRLASDLTLPPVDALAVFLSPRDGAVAIHNGGGDFFGVGGYFDFAGDHAGMLLGALPPIVHIRNESDKAALRWSMERLMQELREPQPGGFLMAQHLAHMMLVQALRLHVADGSKGGVGWLSALADKQMGAAISAMHDDPSRRWTLQELAERAGMSRSTLALKFKATVAVGLAMDSGRRCFPRWAAAQAAEILARASADIGLWGR
jgi:AraC-like DNA-binding protein